MSTALVGSAGGQVGPAGGLVGSTVTITGTGAVTVGAPAIGAFGGGRRAVVGPEGGLVGPGGGLLALSDRIAGDGAVVIGAPSIAGTGDSVPQTGAVTIGVPGVSATGTETDPGTGSVSIGVPAVQGSPLIAGSGGVSLGHPSVDGIGDAVDGLASRVEITHPSVAGSGVEVISGDGGVAIGVSQIVGTGAAPAPTPNWSSNRLYPSPAGQSGISLTPNASVWAWSNWYELEPSASSAWLLASLIVVPDRLGPSATAEFEVGVGAAGFEAPVDRFRGHWNSAFYVSPGELPRPILLDAIAAHQRVSLRMRKNNTSTTPWHVSATYYRKPFTGSVLTSAHPQKTVPDGANNLPVTVGVSAWSNSTWTPILVSIPNPIAVVDIIPDTDGYGGTEWEFDLGRGASPVAAATTVRFHNTILAPADGPLLMPFYQPLAAFPAGSTVSVRTRASDPTFRTASIALVYVELPL